MAIVDSCRRSCDMMKNDVTDQFADRIAKEFGYGECDWLRKMIAERDAATRRDALEEAARIAESTWAKVGETRSDFGDGRVNGYNQAATAIAANIRAAQRPCPARREE